MKSTRVPATIGYFYVFQCGPLFKIGQTEDPRRRVRQLRSATPYPVIVIHKLRTVFYREIEEHLHKVFSDKRVHGEWFRLDACDLDFIKRIDKYGGMPHRRLIPSQPETHVRPVIDWLFAGISSGTGMPAMVMRLSEPSES